MHTDCWIGDADTHYSNNWKNYNQMHSDCWIGDTDTQKEK